MKGKKIQGAAIEKNTYGLVANGSAGAWQVDLDETLEGTQRWFAQIDGPAFYINFQVQHPRIIDEMVTFLRQHLCPDKCLQRSASARDHGAELELSHLGGSVVSLIWDEETNSRCFILMSGKGEFRARLCIERDDLQDLSDALKQMRDELSEEGVLT